MFGIGGNDGLDTGYKYMASVCTGKVIPLSVLEDTVYSTGILGEGYAVITTDKKIYSPVDGVIENISNNGHSFNIISNSGLKILIHIGKDSLCDDSLPIDLEIKLKDKVKQGQVICSYDCDKTDKECIVEVAVANSDSFETFEIISQSIYDIKASVIKYK